MFALDSFTRDRLDKEGIGGPRANRVFVGTNEAYPKEVRALGPIAEDQDGRLKIVVELLTGAEVKDLLPISFFVYPETEIHRIEGAP